MDVAKMALVLMDMDVPLMDGAARGSLPVDG